MDIDQITDEQINALQKTVLSYYKAYGRELPWRQTTDPYKIMVSEMMLQQTQVDRVIPYYTKWIARWPTVAALATAPSKAVMAAWNGLGYNRRARYAQQSAQKIHDDYGDDVLNAVKNYKELPGIGPYTAHAIQIFAANKDIATVDTNIRRIYIHFFGIPESTTDKQLRDLAERCVPKGKSRDWHNALMDYGAMNITARKTGIKPKTIQTKFDGSDRQIRSNIVKMLIKKERPEKEIIKQINEEHERVQSILTQMKKEQVIFKKNNNLTV